MGETATTKRPRLTGPEFFQLCEHVRALRDFFDKEKPNLSEACDILSKKLGRPVSDKAALQAMGATGVSWDRPGRRPDRVGIQRIITDAVLALYEDLGKLPPITLLAVREMLRASKSAL